MYQDRVRICAVGLSDDAVAAIEQVEPLAPLSFTVTVADDGNAADQAAQADLVMAAVSESGALALVERLLEAMRPDADLVLMAPHEAMAELAPALDRVTDVWVSPLTPAEVAWRFSRWQSRRKVRDDYLETDQFLDATINSIPSLVWYKTSDGVHEKVNDAFCTTVRKTKDDVQGQRHAYIWNVEQDDPACIESERVVMSTQQTCVSEEEVQTDAGTRLLTTYKSPLFDLDGTVMGTVGVGIDVTQERAYEKSLLEKNRTLETIFTSLECGLLTHSLDGSRILGINQAALNILGYESEEDLLAHGFDMVAASVVDEDKAMLRDCMKQLQNVGDSVSTEYRVQGPNGEITHVMGNIQLVENDGELYYQRFLLDCTEQKKEERKKERRQRELVQALSEDYLVVCQFNLDTGEGEALRVSEDVGETLGSIFEEPLVYESTIRRYIDFRVLEGDKMMMAEALAPQAVAAALRDHPRIDMLYRTGDENSMEYRQVTVVRAGGWHNDDRHVVVGMRNVDAQIRGEMEKSTLLEDALTRANKASDAKSAFLTNMSHDIRTPMNAIVGFTTLANNHIDDRERVVDYLEKIQASSAHLLSLINDILDMSRIESGKASLDEQACNLREVLDSLGVIMQSEIERNGLTLEIDTDGIVDTDVVCDKLKINQILFNLLGNAIKFTEPGGTVRVTADELDNDFNQHARYRIVVEDTGIGMNQEFLEHIFDPFERERTSTISGIQGTGLGMAITKSLVDMMNGTIEVESEAGKGTKFTIVLTLRLADAPVELKAPVVHPTNVMPSERLHGCRVLLVDDNMLNREIAMTLLEDAGFEVEVAEDGKQAVDMVAAADAGWYQLVLMDVQMPVMNGYDAAVAIRAMDDEAKANVPILAVTADAFDTDRDKALACGMNGHLAKPIEIDRLFRTLDALLP